MSEKIQQQSVKDSYVCPRCRLLFSVPKAVRGNGVHCPGCDELLTVPSPEDGVVAQGVSKVNYQQAGISSLDIRHDEATKEGQWMNERHEVVSGLEVEDKALRWMLPIALTALLILGGLVYIMISSDNGKIQKPRADGKKADEELVAKRDRQFDHQNVNHAARLKEFVTHIYAATTVEELIKYCRPTAGLQARMERYYQVHDLNPKALRKLIKSYPYARIPGFLVFSAEVSDYSIDNGIVEYADGKFMLAWDSYVAYSEMTWQEMKRDKPTKPVLMRLYVREGHYYNNGFKDERKWRSLVISNPNEKSEGLYAYVLRNSAADQQVTNFGISKSDYAVTVKAHYPEDPQSDDQIIISEVVRDSWVQE